MAYHSSQYGAYGATPQHIEAGLSQHTFTPKGHKHKRMTMTTFFICLVVPWLLFTVLYANANFSLHYNSSVLCGCILLLGLLIVMLMFTAAAYEALPHSCHPLARASYSFLPFLKPVHESGWLAFLFFSSALAAMAGTLVGDLNYHTNMQPYYELQTLNVYDSVNPAASQGKEYMDAGRVIFRDDASLDLAKAYRFQDFETYCVAPISTGGDAKTYDFWAVGLDCCDFNASNIVEYKCGPYKSKTAKQGLRLISETKGDFYRLAVQQAEAQYRISAKYPLLFYWTEDAEADMKGYWQYGFKYFTAGVFAFPTLQIFLIIVNTVLVGSFGFGSA